MALNNLSSTYICFTIFAICPVIEQHKETKAIQQAKTLLSWNAQKRTVNGNEYPKPGILQIFRVQTLIRSSLGFWKLRPKQ